MKLFQYAIIHKPTAEKDKKAEKSQLLKSKQGFLITSVLADDLDKAKLLAARDIPDEYMDRLDEIDLAIRPF